jgi:hypothetical protein
VAGSIALSVEPAAVSVAARTDEAGLRRLMRESVMPGAVRIAFTREPDYFSADGLAGAEDVTIVARREGQVTGSGRCSVYPMLRNGVRHRIGYLGLLRVAAGTSESPRLIRDGYELLRGDVESRADGFFTSIASDNVRARRVLELGGRLGLPAYRRLCDLVTLIAPVRSITAKPGDAVSDDELVAFLAQDSRRFQLSLAWDHTALQDLARHGVSARDFTTVRRNGRIVACAAIWDQRAFRQTVIDGYEGALAHLRPIINAALVMRGRPRLPAPGTVLDQAAILGASVPDSREWGALWHELQARASQRGLSWLAIARDARDPEVAILRRLTRGHEYRTSLYEVTWAGGERWPDPWDERVFRPEVGLL